MRNCEDCWHTIMATTACRLLKRPLPFMAWYVPWSLSASLSLFVCVCLFLRSVCAGTHPREWTTGCWHTTLTSLRYNPLASHHQVANHYFDGAAYPLGGCAELARALVPTIRSAGGDALVRARVDSIVVEDGAAVGVRLSLAGNPTRVVRAPLVICACGARNTYERLLPREHCPRRALTALSDTASVVSTGHVMLFVGLDCDGSDLPACNYWVAPTPNHDANTAAHQHDPSQADFPAVFISFPSRKDPDYARRYPGKTTAAIIAGANIDMFREWADERVRHRGKDYDAVKHNIAMRLLAALFELHPELEDKVDFWELGTPLSTQHYIGSLSGESYGLAATPRRFHQSALTSVQTGVCGVW